MENNLTFTAGNKPYFDLFNSHDNILNVLFKPGLNLRPEYLNLLQSYIQEQIAILGSYFLRNATFISGGNYKIVNTNFIMFCKSNNIIIPDFSLKGLIFKHIDSDCLIKITSPKLPLSEIKSENFDKKPENYFAQTIEKIYGNFPEGNNFEFYLWDEKNNTFSNQQLVLQIFSFDPVTFIALEKGVIFLDGYFVYFNEQLKIFKPLTFIQQLYSFSIGFRVKKSIVSSTLDNSLKDNAFDTFAFGVSGADRLKIELLLDNITLIEDDNFFDVTIKDNFFEFLRVKNNEIIKDVRVPVLTEFEKTLARRTYDESGSYTVKPFKIQILDQTDQKNDFILKISPGKAYIFGHECEKLNYSTLSFNKCYEQSTKDNNTIVTPNGFYLEFNNSIQFNDTLNYFIDISNLETLFLYDVSDMPIGTAKCYNFSQEITNFKLYICNIIFFEKVNSFTNIYSVKSDSNFKIGIVTSFSGTPINSLRYSFDKNIKKISNLTSSGKKVITDILENTIYIPENETFSSDISNYILFDENKLRLNIINIEFQENFITFRCLSNEICKYAICKNVKFKMTEILRVSQSISKTFYANKTIKFTINDELDSLIEILYKNQNIIKDFSINFREESSEFIIGGFDLLYTGKLDLIGDIKVSYKKWLYTQEGHYLITNNYLDFRKNLEHPSNFVLDSNSEISYTKTFNLGRIDKLVLTKDLSFELVSGTPGLNPVPPKERSDAMTLYTLNIPPNVLTSQGIGIKFHENKRYTMRDIGKLEKRIENLEYYTSLNLLEKETSDQKFLDNNGNNRFKNGFLVDNFKTFKSVSLSDIDCKFSLDTDKGHLRPRFTMTPIDAEYNKSKSTSILSNKLITLPYKEVNFIDQSFASSVINVNFYETFTWEGKVVLSPENDYWVDTTAKPDIFLNNFGENDIYSELGEKGFNAKWNSWEKDILNNSSSEDEQNFNKTEKRLWNPNVKEFKADKNLIDTYKFWVSSGFQSGFPNKNVPDGYIDGVPSIFQVFKLPGSTLETAKDLSASKIQTSSLGESLASVSFASYMRAIPIQFDVTCLKPLTFFYVIFDDLNVSNYCQLKGTTTYNNLISNEFGELSGTFYLPEKKFLVGTKIFKIVDSLDKDIGSFAISQFFSKGMLNESQEAFLSTREPIAILPPVSLNVTIPKTLSNEEVSELRKSKEYNISLSNIILPTKSVEFSDVKYKVYFSCSGAANFNVLKDNIIVLTAKTDATVFVTVFENELLTVDIFENEFGLYDSNIGLPFLIKPKSRNYQSTIKIIKETNITISFTKPEIVKIKVSLKNISNTFLTGIPYYNIKFDCLLSTTLSDGTEMNPVLSRLRSASVNDPISSFTPSPTPSNTLINLFETPSPTPSISNDFYATRTPTPSPTPSKTPSKSFSPTPTSTKDTYGENNFSPLTSIISQNIIETIEINMVIGDSINVDYFRKGTATINFCDDISSDITWSTLTENSSSFILTKEHTKKYKDQKVILYLTPLDRNILQIKIKGNGFPFNLKWLITDFVSTKVSYSGTISIPANGFYVNLPELLDTTLTQCDYLKLIPLDKLTFEKINFSARMFFEESNQTKIESAHSPFGISKNVFTGEISNILLDDSGIRIKQLIETELNFPKYISNGDNNLKTCYIEISLSSSPNVTPSPTLTLETSSNILVDKSTFFYKNETTENENLYTSEKAIRPLTDTISRGLIEFDSKKISPKIPNYPDALAQSFFIDEKFFPEGIFLSSVDLYFKTKDNTIPVSLELRPNVNSYPSSKVVIPFSRVTKPAHLINISENATASTNFKFSDPVYLKPGEYNFVIYSDSLMYKIWIAKLGEFKIGSTSERIIKNPYSGSLFKSSNGTAWLPEMESDFTFKINRCSFTPLSASCYIQNKPYNSKEYNLTNLEFSTIKTNVINVLPSNTTIKTSEVYLIKSNGTKELPIFLDINTSKEFDVTYMVKDLDTTPYIESKITLFSNKESVSPIIDVERLSYILIYNEINKLLTSEDEESELKSSFGKAKAKYITKPVQLNLDILANKLNISFAASCKKGTQVRVYYRILNSILDDKEFFKFKKWVEIGKVTKVAKDNETFIDFSFETTSPIIYDGNSKIVDFDLFSIKLVLESENNTVPLIKDFRVVALTE